MIAPALAAAMVLALAGQAAAQDGNRYRQGMPEVLVPASPGPGAVAESFASTYRSQRQPRIMVFWMRSLSDQPSSERYKVERTDETVVVGTLAAGGAVSHRGWGAGAVEAYSAGVGAGHRVLRHEEREGFVPEPSHDPLASSVSREAEAVFLAEFARAGARIVDRATAIRLSAAPSGDPIASETEALKSKADLLIEVGAGADAWTAGRLSYRVDIRSLRDGTIIASFVTDAEPRPGIEAAFATAPGLGYVEKPGSALGQELALQAMERMTEAWRR